MSGPFWSGDHRSGVGIAAAAASRLLLRRVRVGLQLGSDDVRVRVQVVSLCLSGRRHVALGRAIALGVHLLLSGAASSRAVHL
eukprot:5877009-Pyramimonas_sp.AAC.1